MRSPTQQADIGFFAIDPKTRRKHVLFTEPVRPDRRLLRGWQGRLAPGRANDEGRPRGDSASLVGRGSAYELYLSQRTRRTPRWCTRPRRRRWSTTSWVRAAAAPPGRRAAARWGRRAHRRIAIAARPLHGDPPGDGPCPPRSRGEEAPPQALSAFVERAKASGFVAARAGAARHPGRGRRAGGADRYDRDRNAAAAAPSRPHLRCRRAAARLPSRRRRLVPQDLPGAHRGAGRRLAGDPRRPPHAGRGADRLGQDADRLPRRARRAGAPRPRAGRPAPTRRRSSTSRR